jgi:peptidyl-prolyl cis-trans isomerase SurA
MQLANRYGVRIPDQQLDEAMTRLARQNSLTLEQFRVAVEQSGPELRHDARGPA